MSYIIKNLQIIILTLCVTSITHAASYSAGTTETPPAMDKTDSTGTSSVPNTPPATATPVTGASTVKPAATTATALQTNPDNKHVSNNLNYIVLSLKVVNSSMHLVPAYIWLNELNYDGTTKNAPSKKGDAPQGKAFVKYVKRANLFR